MGVRTPRTDPAPGTQARRRVRPCSRDAGRLGHPPPPRIPSWAIPSATPSDEPPPPAEGASAAAIGWSDFFAAQVTAQERAAGWMAGRVCGVQARRCRVWCPGESDGDAEATPPTRTLEAALFGEAGLPTAGDWVLMDPRRKARPRKLEARTTLTRQAPGGRGDEQALAANVDTLLIVTACNREFSLARTERYLALAFGTADRSNADADAAGVRPVVVLTHADVADDAAAYVARVEEAAPGVRVLCVDARGPAAAEALADLCGPGQTVAVLGSSGVGKSTLVNALSDAGQAVGAARAEDDRGRHTTTARTLHRLRAGGVVVDLPGIRELRLAGAGSGIDSTYAAEAEVAASCRFRNCRHTGEPGCAVAEALADGRLDRDRWSRYRTLWREQNERADRRRDRDRRG